MSSNEAFKALADPTRRSILAMLRSGEKTAGELAEHFDMTKPSMSHHFAVLREADLITSRREAQQIWYALNTSVVEELLGWVKELLGKQKSKGAESETTKLQTHLHPFTPRVRSLKRPFRLSRSGSRLK